MEEEVLDDGGCETEYPAAWDTGRKSLGKDWDSVSGKGSGGKRPDPGDFGGRAFAVGKRTFFSRSPGAGRRGTIRRYRDYGFGSGAHPSCGGGSGGVRPFGWGVGWKT